MLSTRLTVSAALAIAAIAIPSLALANDCGPDQPCPKGFACEALATPCAAIDCAPDSVDCVKTCASSTVNVCVAKSCNLDSDCAEGMACQKTEYEQCSAGTAGVCPPGAGCDPVEPTSPSCSWITSSSCVPKWTMPCQAAADCGEGFTCDAAVECACSGSSGTAASGGASATLPSLVEPGSEPVGEGGATSTGMTIAPGESSCSCRTLETKYCKVIERSCSSANACPTGWSCSANAANSTCTASSDGTTYCSKEESPSMCMPPYSDLGYGYGAGGSTGIDAGEATGTAVNPVVPKASDDTAPSGAPTTGNTGAVAAGGANSSGTVAATTPAPNANNDGTVAAGPNTAAPLGNDVVDSGDEGAGCQLSARSTYSNATSRWASMLGIVGALGLALSRRRRQA